MPKLPYLLRQRFFGDDAPDWIRLGIVFSSGLLMGLATAPINAFGLAWVALVPLWTIVLGQSSLPSQRDRRPHSPAPIRDAIAWGLGYHGLALSWITGLHPLTWLGMPWIASVFVALFCWLFITLWGAALVAIWVWLLRKLLAWPSRSVNPYIHVLYGTALWCGLEWIWSLGALYWTSLSYTQSPGNLWILHLGQLTGPTAVTAAIVAVNGLLAVACLAGFRGEQSQVRRFAHIPAPLLVACCLVGMLHVGGYWLYHQPLQESPATALPVGIVQGNVPTRIKLTPGGVKQAIAGYANGYELLASQGAAAVLTPEGALPILWNDRTKERSPFYQAVLQRGVVAWLGTFNQTANGRITQSLLTLTGTGDTFSRYNKIKLVPLGEYIPFQETLGRLINRLSPIEADMLPGTADQRFDTPFGRVIASICYESAFPELFRAQAADGGEFILTASNLDPYSEVLMAQHQAQDLMRAIETDRWAVRATNTGYSGVINPHGQIIWQSQPHTYQTHMSTVYRRQTQTPYVRWGDWLTPTLLFLAGSIWLSQQAILARTNRQPLQ